MAAISGYQRLSHAPPRHPRFFVLRMTKTHYTASPSGIISRILIKAPVRRIHVDNTPLFACSSERYAPLFLPVEKI
ncbi:hypothetical protein, partial [Enterocloster clostridioformis]|uniref:hypothetical protein n=1 Tax=Enterocloster clostridioformis TaxID=1531 RepID=UPI001F2663DE